MLNFRRGKKQTFAAIATLVFLLILAACSGAAPAASTDVPAATDASTEPTGALAEATEVVEPTEAPAEEAAATEVTEEEVDAAATEAPAEEAAGATGSVTFVIDPAQSVARFTLTELLMGTPTTVVGSGSGIQGDVTVNFDDYSQSAISPIVIDASMLETDSNMRNGQIRRAILQTNNPDYQFITFTPTAVEGLPESAAVGEPFDISVTGDLTIRDITKPMTFEVTVTPLSETQIQGNARTTLLRDDFDLTIPSVPSVADVSEEVLLEFDFLANAQ